MEQVMLDMIPTGAKAVCHVSQYDIGRTIRFNLRSGGAAYTLAGTETVKVYIKKPDGTTAERNIANTSSTYVDWVTGEGDCDQAGKCECELIITAGTTVIGSKNFIMNVEEDPYNDQGVVTETAGPAVIATFTTNVVDLLQEVKCSINPIQNGTPWIDSNVINKEPYIKRSVAGTATRIGNHLYDKLVGGTVAFNQLANITTASTTDHDVIFTNNNDGTWTISGTANGTAYKAVTVNAHNGQGHVMFYSYGAVSVENEYRIGDFNNGQSISFAKSAVIIKKGTANTVSIGVQIYDTKSINITITPQIIDLTAMFGSTIADYIYSLEQETAGAGVAWFKALFPNDYYAYNAGEHISVKATAHIMRDASNNVIGNYPLDSNLELRGMPKLVNNKLEYDGDIYESSGDVTRRLSSVTLDGNINPNNLGVTVLDNYTQVSYMPYINIGVGAHSPFLCDKHFIHAAKPSAEIKEGDIYNSGVASAPRMFLALPKTVTTAAEAVAWFANNPTTVLFYIATPTTESADPFTNPQVCDENGTEEYTDSRAVAIPVGHETYQANICEITGFDELNIQQSGVNIWDEEWEVGNIDGTGADSPANDRIRSKNYIRVPSDTNIYLVTPAPMVLHKYALDKTYLGNNYISASGVYAVGSNVAYIRFRTDTSYGTTYNNDISINNPNTDTQYHSYSGKLIKLEFDDTVYLAEVSCLNGVWKLKLLGAEYVVDSAAKIYRNTGNSWYADPTNGKHYATAQETVISDKFAQGQTQNQNVCFMHPNGLIRFNTAKSYDTASDLLADIGTFTFVYPLETPVEITLDETEQFESLLGVNNVWHDGNGNTEVKYLYNA